MKRVLKRLAVKHETIRQLDRTEIVQVASAGSQLATCSICGSPFYGCHTGNNC